MSKPIPTKPSPADAALERATRTQLQSILRHDVKTSVPGIYRASDDALRGAIRQYLRMKRLTEQQVIEGVKP